MSEQCRATAAAGVKIMERNMADIRHFSGEQQLKSIHSISKTDFAARFPGVKGRRSDGYSMLVGYPLSGAGGTLPVERVIEYKRFASKHVCGSKCLNGKVNGICECSCEGRNHGLGSVQTFTELIESEVAA